MPLLGRQDILRKLVTKASNWGNNKSNKSLVLYEFLLEVGYILLQVKRGTIHTGDHMGVDVHIIIHGLTVCWGDESGSETIFTA